MIDFNYKTPFSLENEDKYRKWIVNGVDFYGYEIGEVNYFFYSDEEMLKINQDYLNHDFYTDIISFDYSTGKVLSGDICISVDRVQENSKTYKTSFKEELSRVMSHGLLHFMGFKDKTKTEQKTMRDNEQLFINLLNNK